MAPDAIVVGSGPNGLAAAIVLARAGVTVLVLEGEDAVGGGVRTEELTLPGFRHDVCSAIHPLAVASPFLKTLPLERHGVEWIHPDAPLAHPFDDGDGRGARAVDRRDGRDARARRPAVPEADGAARRRHAPRADGRDPRAAARTAAPARCSPASGRAACCRSHGLARPRFAASARAACSPAWRRTRSCRSTRSPTAAFGLMLGVLGHAVGWPLARGGSQRDRGRAGRAPARRSAARSRPAGGRRRSPSCRRARAVLLDVTPRQLLAIAGDRLPSALPPPPRAATATGPACSSSTGRSTGRSRGGPRRARARRPCTSAARSTRSRRPSARRRRGAHAERPFILVAQQTPVRSDPRARGQAHGLGVLPRAATARRVDMTERDRGAGRALRARLPRSVLARRTMGPARSSAHNPNYVGGDINGGVADLRQLFTRPVARLDPVRDAGPAASSSARRRPRPAAASTACAAATRPARRCGTSSAAARKVAQVRVERVRRFRYVLADVFTDTALEGNQLAVFTDARDLDPLTMQALARETNLSETVFVLPPQAEGADVRIRIFTPAAELPFAGPPDARLGLRARRAAAGDRAPARDRRGESSRSSSSARGRKSPSAGWSSRSRRGSRSPGRPSCSRRSGSTARGRPVELLRQRHADTSWSGSSSADEVAALAPDINALGRVDDRGTIASRPRTAAGRRACSRRRSASPRIPRPARRRGRSRSISHGTGGSGSARRSRSRRASRSVGPSKLYARVEGSADADRARPGRRLGGDRRARRVRYSLIATASISGSSTSSAFQKMPPSRET